MKTKVKVLCVTNFYLPGFKAGGPIRTIANMSDLLAGKLEFAILTQDRDLGEKAAYPGITVNDWQPVGRSQVYYADRATYGVRAVERQLGDHDILYLNSFFSYRGSISLYLHFRRRGRILIAPRGEFSKGALSLKRFKKQAFIFVANLFGLYRDVHWHASTAMEADDIQRVFPHASGKIHLAADPVVLGNFASPPATSKVAGRLRVGFISRIDPMKNLDELISIMSQVERDVELNIFGPIKDVQYWNACQGMIEQLPANIQVKYQGIVEADQVSSVFADHDLFVLPTRGENFGHVIFESLRAGTPVLLSDRTPWKPDAAGALTVLPLDSTDAWRMHIEAAADRNASEQEAVRRATLEYARAYAVRSNEKSDNLKMFMSIAA